MKVFMEKRVPTIQNFPWQASIDAIKSSENYSSYDEFYANLIESLPHNSYETRRKYAGLIQRRFFPEKSLDGLLPLVWKHYQDESMLKDLMRVYAVESEPVIAKFILQELGSRLPGNTIEQSQVKTFISTIYGGNQVDSYNRLLNSCRDMGFVSRYDGVWLIEEIPMPKNAFMILLHDRLAPAPRIVRLNEIIDATWWHYSGLRGEDQVREILREAESAGLIARFAKVDELEQVTTRYAQLEYIHQALRL
jgi:hypothetical protein